MLVIQIFKPWIGYFNLIKNAEIFIVYDSAPISKQSWQQRNKMTITKIRN